METRIRRLFTVVAVAVAGGRESSPVEAPAGESAGDSAVIGGIAYSPVGSFICPSPPPGVRADQRKRSHGFIVFGRGLPVIRGGMGSLVRSPYRLLSPGHKPLTDSSLAEWRQRHPGIAAIHQPGSSPTHGQYRVPMRIRIQPPSRRPTAVEWFGRFHLKEEHA